MKCGARAVLGWQAGRVRRTTTLRFWRKNNEIRHEVRALEEDLHVEQRRSVEASLSEVHDRLKQAPADKSGG
jgi:phosphoglycerate-specific signal transduction histidine kinase